MHPITIDENGTPLRDRNLELLHSRAITSTTIFKFTTDTVTLLLSSIFENFKTFGDRIRRKTYEISLRESPSCEFRVRGCDLWKAGLDGEETEGFAECGEGVFL